MSDGHEQGVALVAAAMAMMLLLALGATLILVTSSETAIAGNYRTGGEVLYAADAVVQRVIAEIKGVADWNALLDGSSRSSFVDGAPSGTRRLSDGSTIDLAHVVNLANCAKRTTCSDAETAATTQARPWGANNPRWQLYAYGRLDDLAAGEPLASPYYVVAMVADDGSENDGEPRRDGVPFGALPNPGKDVMLVRGEALGPRGAQRAVEVVLSRYRKDELDLLSPPGIRVHVWRKF